MSALNPAIIIKLLSQDYEINCHTKKQFDVILIMGLLFTTGYIQVTGFCEFCESTDAASLSLSSEASQASPASLAQGEAAEYPDNLVTQN